MFDNFLIWLDDRTAIPALIHKFRHWNVPSTKCCGKYFPTLIMFAFFLQVLTGILLWTFYSPSALSAWESLFYLQFKLPGGWMIRGIHHFSAQLLPVLLGFYLLGLVVSGRYRSPREFVFWSAFVLFLFSLASSLTGDLLSWTLSGLSATLVRVRFLQMIPFIGEPLFRIVCGGPEFGTLTLPRFLVLHILVFGGGFFVFLVLWRIFDNKAGQCSAAALGKDKEACRSVPLFPNEFLKRSLAVLLLTAVVVLLVYRIPVLHTFRPQTFPVNENLPREAYLGVHIGAPADPAGFYDAARPEWSFRALYHFCNLKVKQAGGTEIDVFPGERKFIPIFVVTGCLAVYIILIPVTGRLRIGHCFNVIAVVFLFGALSYLTYASYYHDYFEESMQAFRDDEAAAERQAERAIELSFAGIPPTGALTLLQNDPLTQGPALYKQHCAVCHPFAPLAGEQEHPDFKAIACETPKAPNLYNPVRKEWIAGFLDQRKIRSADYFANTKLNTGTMTGYVRGELKEALEDNEAELDKLVAFLESEAKRNLPRSAAELPVNAENELFATFGCGQCHKTYEANNKPVIQAPDLRGYMSRDWIMGIIADPESKRFYGPPVGKDKGNDAMPAFYRSEADAVLSPAQIETLTDWLRGKWYRFQKVSAVAEKMQPLGQ
ncbi:MAG: cytochrome b N-terminal domain-containing protein [Planctomycetaceae bacterium]|jgi:ubiquinol-cytochrome c reductase cytochrome b subunit|nr:cytochrome b N-terminal domain-containing protein [Planctomycetaceae bacterium]